VNPDTPEIGVYQICSLQVHFIWASIRLFHLIKAILVGVGLNPHPIHSPPRVWILTIAHSTTIMAIINNINTNTSNQVNPFMQGKFLNKFFSLSKNFLLLWCKKIHNLHFSTSKLLKKIFSMCLEGINSVFITTPLSDR